MNDKQFDRRLTHIEDETRHLREHLAEDQPQWPARIDLGDGAWWGYDPGNDAAYVHMKPEIGNFSATDDVGRGLREWLRYDINKPTAPAAVRAYAAARGLNLIQHPDPALAFLCGSPRYPHPDKDAVWLGDWQNSYYWRSLYSVNGNLHAGTPHYVDRNLVSIHHAEALRRVRVLGLAVQEQPSALRACYNTTCAHQRGGVCYSGMVDVANCVGRVAEPPAAGATFCRQWARCTSLAKAECQPCCGCSDYEPDTPAPATTTSTS